MENNNGYFKNANIPYIVDYLKSIDFYLEAKRRQYMVVKKLDNVNIKYYYKDIAVPL